MHCPICDKPLEGGELVMVCSPCASASGATAGGLALGATGEFRVPSPAMLEAHAAQQREPPTTEPAQRPHVTGTCAWCGKLEGQVKKLLGRAGVALCNECVALSSDIMEAELGPDWRM